MAIDTDNKKLALITYHQPWNTPIPIVSNGFTQGDLQHLIWEYPEFSWTDIGRQEVVRRRSYITTSLELESSVTRTFEVESPTTTSLERRSYIDMEDA